MCRRTLGLTLALAAVLAADAAFGAESPRAAATAQLPEALLAVGGSAAVVAEGEAVAVRGQWTLQLSLPRFAAAIQGVGPFQLNVLTSSGGLTAPDPICIRIRLGH